MAADLKRMRAMQKNHLAYFKNAKIFVHTNLALAKKNQVKLRLEEMIETRNSFLKNQMALEVLDEDEVESDIRSIIDNYYYELRPAFEDKLEEFKDVKKEGADTRVAEDMGLMPKLPELKLEIFSGEVKDWPRFIASFNSHVHGNLKLKTITKFQFLRNAITGLAAKVIENLDFSAENYEEALKLLSERYNKPHIIAEGHIRALFRLKPIEKSTSQKLLGLLDDVNSHLRSLKSLKRPTEYWDDLIVHLMVSKLDTETRNKWKEEAPQTAMPTLEDISNFIKSRSHMIHGQRVELDAPSIGHMNSNSQCKSFGLRSGTAYQRVRPANSLHVYRFFCVNCKQEGHSIIRCHKFLALSVDDRKKLALDAKLCLHCLKPSHAVNDCPVQDVCRLCQSRHHTLIHIHPTPTSNKPQSSSHLSIVRGGGDVSGASQANNTLNNATVSLAQHQHCSFIASIGEPSYTFLATVQVYVSTGNKETVACRALLDTGSQLNFISKSLSSKLGLPPVKQQLHINGIGGSATQSMGALTINIISRIGNFTTELEVNVLSRITSDQPSIAFVPEDLGIPNDIELADPSFYEPRAIDFLIGNELVYDINLDGRLQLGSGIMLQNTTLGWIVAGRCALSGSVNESSVCVASSWHQKIERFWNLDEELIKLPPTREEKNPCEQHFISTHQRNDVGRFVLRLPFAKSVQLLGDSSKLALKRFLNLERRLDRDAVAMKSYCDFIDEYIRLGHMELVRHIPHSKCYLPHFAVYSESTSTRLRVVFDGSAKTSNGISLNQILMVGPVVQSDLASVLLRFRSYAWVFSTDIVKMYRQFLIHQEDRRYQFIYRRFSSSNLVQTYQLNTVTYGLGPASYMATRCLQELVLQYQEEFPNAAARIEKDCYVDNILTGSNSVVELAEIKLQIITILAGAGMSLKKWGTNNKRLLQSITEADRETSCSIDGDELMKVLGLLWSVENDCFKIKVQPKNFSNKFTKRSVISDVAKIFDPLGLIAPVVVLAKMLMQRLWSLKIDWDAKLPIEIQKEWLTYRNELSELKHLSVPRHLFGGCENPTEIQLHCFADASEKAYGGCIYIRSRSNNNVISRLVCSKSRIAPKGKTIPKLELCAAELVAKMAAKYKEVVNYPVEELYFWSDSTIVLHWINTPIHDLEVFVANRIKTIHHLSLKESWRHVDSKSNPADIVSRGMKPSLLIATELWWNDPDYLLQDSKEWNCLFLPTDTVVKSVAHVAALEVDCDMLSGLHHHNSFMTLQHTFGFVMRYLHNLKWRGRARNGKLSLAEVAAGHDID